MFLIRACLERFRHRECLFKSDRRYEHDGGLTNQTMIQGQGCSVFLIVFGEGVDPRDYVLLNQLESWIMRVVSRLGFAVNAWCSNGSGVGNVCSSLSVELCACRWCPKSQRIDFETV